MRLGDANVLIIIATPDGAANPRDNNRVNIDIQRNRDVCADK